MEKLSILCLLIFIANSTNEDLSYKLCRSQSDCGKNYCCAIKKITHKYGFCMPTKGLGDICTPSYLYGTSFTCGCEIGLTCALVEKDKITQKSHHRCVQILPEPKEHTEGQSLIISESNNLLTASELSRLLKLANYKPKRRK